MQDLIECAIDGQGGVRRDVGRDLGRVFHSEAEEEDRSDSERDGDGDAEHVVRSDGERVAGKARVVTAGTRASGGKAAVGGSGSGSGSAARLHGRSVTVNRAESPLTWLRSRGLIDARQFAAGERLRTAYETASLAPSVTMRWTPRVDGGGHDSLDPTTAQIAAKRRFDAAVAAAGPGLADILWRVVCAGEGLPAAERALSWPARAGRLVLTLALDRLATHYAGGERTGSGPGAGLGSGSGSGGRIGVSGSRSGTGSGRGAACASI